MDGVGVRVDPADDMDSCCHDGSQPLCGNGQVRRRLVRADRTLMRLRQALIRSSPHQPAPSPRAGRNNW